MARRLPVAPAAGTHQVVVDELHPHPRQPGRRRDGGSAALELVLLVPLFVVLLLAVGHAGRVAHARSQVRAAAEQAARAASLARSSSQAAAAARAAATASREVGLGCRTLRVDVDLTDFRPGGVVTVTVHCTASFSDLGLLGVPGERVISAGAAEVLDRWRAG